MKKCFYALLMITFFIPLNLYSDNSGNLLYYYNTIGDYIEKTENFGYHKVVIIHEGGKYFFNYPPTSETKYEIIYDPKNGYMRVDDTHDKSASDWGNILDLALFTCKNSKNIYIGFNIIHFGMGNGEGGEGLRIYRFNPSGKFGLSTKDVVPKIQLKDVFKNPLKHKTLIDKYLKLSDGNLYLTYFLPQKGLTIKSYVSLEYILSPYEDDTITNPKKAVIDEIKKKMDYNSFQLTWDVDKEIFIITKSLKEERPKLTSRIKND